MIWLTGGTGLLGQELQKHIKCYAPPRSEWDFAKGEFTLKHDFDLNKDLIVHAGAFTDLVSAEKNKQECYNVNVIGTRNLASLNIPMVYISTEYVFDGEKGNYDETDYQNPQNYYSVTKLLGEYEARRTRSVVIRCAFKRRPFEHDAGCIDQFTSADYVDIIAPKIVKVINQFERMPATIHIGTGRKSWYELGRQTKEIGEITRGAIRGVRLPEDTSLNTSLYERLFNEKN